MASVGTPDPDPNPGWLTEDELAEARAHLPLLYVEAVPVRVDGLGKVIEVGMLLRANDGEITRTLVSGRVMYGETLRDALFRHLEKDLGPMAFPLLPANPVPFSVAEYFPWPGSSQFMDARQHAVSLAYVVPDHRHLRTPPGRPRGDVAAPRRGRVGRRRRRHGGRPRVAAADGVGVGGGAAVGSYRTIRISARPSASASSVRSPSGTNPLRR